MMMICTICSQHCLQVPVERYSYARLTTCYSDQCKHLTTSNNLPSTILPLHDSLKLSSLKSVQNPSTQYMHTVECTVYIQCIYNVYTMYIQCIYNVYNVYTMYSQCGHSQAVSGGCGENVTCFVGALSCVHGDGTIILCEKN